MKSVHLQTIWEEFRQHVWLARKFLRYLILCVSGRQEKQEVLLDYRPLAEHRTEKAERLVDFCLGDYAERPIVPCSLSSRYLARKQNFSLLESDERRMQLNSGWTGRPWDQKRIMKALVSQKSSVPPGLCCWLVAGDSSGISSVPAQGVHIAGMRRLRHQHLVLMPTANRQRFLGRRLAQQMEELRRLWTPWELKSDSAWWGGALTGDLWTRDEPQTITRREVLEYFRDHPSDSVHLHVSQLPSDVIAPPGIEEQRDFTKDEAFRHKCVILLPGNDIASGSSWYFAGNSVVLMPRPHMDHILYFELEPWEHYVPLENDPADILVKLDWVLNHQDEAQKIVRNSHERLKWLCGPEYLWACNEVLRKIASAR